MTTGFFSNRERSTPPGRGTSSSASTASVLMKHARSIDASGSAGGATLAVTALYEHSGSPRTKSRSAGGTPSAAPGAGAFEGSGSVVMGKGEGSGRGGPGQGDGGWRRSV